MIQTVQFSGDSCVPFQTIFRYDLLNCFPEPLGDDCLFRTPTIWQSVLIAPLGKTGNLK